jgi:hypothetical protein
MFFISNNRFRVSMNVGLPLFALIVFRWLSINRGRFVIVTPAVSRIGSVGKVIPAKNGSSSAISSCQCYCISCSRSRIAQSPPLTAERHLLRQCTLFSPTKNFRAFVGRLIHKRKRC